MSQQTGWGQPTNKTLADYVKESAWQSSLPTNNTTSMPWAAAVKSPPDHNTSVTAGLVASSNSYEYNNTMGSWSSPETSSSNRTGWNADGSLKSDGALDDGTAIWGNPTSKKTGVDWTEKESSINPPQAQANNNLEKRIQKPEPTISSINGTEAWGAPFRSSSNIQQQQSKNDNSGNTYETTKTGSNPSSSLSWGESSSLQSAASATKNENSSPPNNSVWNNLGVNSNKQKSSEWLSSSSGIGGGSNSSTVNSRLDELNKQLESVSLFDSVSTIGKNTNMNNNQNLDHHHSIAVGSSVGGITGGNGINDLKQMSANYSNDLLDANCQSGNGSLASNNNQQSQKLDSSAYSSATAPAAGAAPSRDLLKQMVHQIQLAVQAGHLNAHILNQPLSAPTLQLVYQLLQQIKTLHQLQEIQQRAGIKSDMTSPTNLDLQINRTRQNILILQKAITQQQAPLTKNETLNESNTKQQQQEANNYSYATISKLSTNMKVPSNNLSNTISNSNIESFRRSSFIDTISNSNSDSLRSAQAPFDANATLDKTLSSLILASSSANNILVSNKSVTTSGDFSKTQGFNSGNVNNQRANKGLLPAQSSSSSSAWSAFSSSNYGGSQQCGWPNQLRISSNVSQDHQHQFSAFDMMPDYGSGKSWGGSSVMADCAKSNSNNISSGSGGIEVARPNSALNNLKQMNENDVLTRDPSLFCDWSNNSDSGKKNFDPNTASSFSSSAIGGLSLQWNPWMFSSTSQSLNIGSGMENTNKTSNINKMDNGNTDKMAGDSLFLKSNNPCNIQRSSSALYDWQFDSDTNQIAKQQQSLNPASRNGGVGGGAGRPAPPPGLLSNFGPSTLQLQMDPNTSSIRFD